MAVTDIYGITKLAEAQDNPDVTVNTAIEKLEQAGDGTLVHDMTSDADYTLDVDDADGNENLNRVIEITDTGTVLTATRNIIFPATTKVVYFVNSTAQSLVPKTSGGTGPTVTTGQEGWIRCDGTDVVKMSPSW